MEVLYNGVTIPLENKITKLLRINYNMFVLSGKNKKNISFLCQKILIVLSAYIK